MPTKEEIKDRDREALIACQAAVRGGHETITRPVLGAFMAGSAKLSAAMLDGCLERLTLAKKLTATYPAPNERKLTVFRLAVDVPKRDPSRFAERDNAVFNALRRADRHQRAGEGSPWQMVRHSGSSAVVALGSAEINASLGRLMKAGRAKSQAEERANGPVVTWKPIF